MDPVNDKPGKQIEIELTILPSLWFLFVLVVFSIYFAEHYKEATKNHLFVYCYNHTAEAYSIRIYDQNTWHRIAIPSLKDTQEMIEYKQKYGQGNKVQFDIQVLTHDGKMLIMEKTLRRPDDIDRLVWRGGYSFCLNIDKTDDGEYQAEIPIY